MIKSILIILINLFLLSCTQNSKSISGTSNETETGSVVSGILLDSAGKALKNQLVNLYPASHIASLGESDLQNIYSTTTDNKGAFKFDIDSLNNGIYYLESFSDSNNGIREIISVEPSATTLPITIKLKSTGNLTGTAVLPDNEYGKIILSILATNRTLVAEQGSYHFNNLAAGYYTLMLRGFQPDRAPILKSFFINESETTNLDTLLMEPAPFFYPGTISGTVQIPQGDSGQFKLSINGMIFNDLNQITGEFNIPNLSPGSYTLKAWGINPPRDTILSMVEVKPATHNEGIAFNLLSPLPGNLTANITLPPLTKGGIGIKIVETGFDSLLDSATRLNLPPLAPGNYTLKIWGTFPKRDTVAKVINIISGDDIITAIELKQISVLIIDGIATHHWERITSNYLDILNWSMMYNVEVSTTPAFGSPIGAWDTWDPNFKNYDVVVMNYGESFFKEHHPWPRHKEIEFENYMANGGGLVNTQITGVAFANWVEFNNMIGLGFRDPSFGQGISLDSSFNLDTIPLNTPRAWDGTRKDYTVYLYNSTHPITNGLPNTWLHANDVMDFGLRGPIRNLDVLSFSHVDTEGHYEPVEWVVQYHNGRVYSSTMGDVVENDTNDPLKCAGFQSQLIRAVEWAATGQVTYQVPIDFPTDSTTTLRDNLSQ